MQLAYQYPSTTFQTAILMTLRAENFMLNDFKSAFSTVNQVYYGYIDLHYECKRGMLVN